MAKILSVKLVSIPEVIIVNDSNNDFTIDAKIEFHELDLQLKMEYCLHLFVYEVHGQLDAPLIVSNWDESRVVSISQDRKDEYLGRETKMIVATLKKQSYEIPMSLNLGKLTNRSSHFSKKIEVFATMTPAIGRASKWSLPFESKIVF
ncbi:hypothetical protein [Polaribacter sp.]|uniref:hypothetical protein n=1 Tax=Polaribacter sp. TaxID=1920175 RepID=UPI003EF7A38E